MAVASPQGIIRVIDADTWDVADTRVRLHGIDAPEMAQTCDSQQRVSWPCGHWVSDQVRAHYDGKIAICETITTDRYNRTVARCWVDGRDAGQDMVANGLAFAYRKYSMEYDLDEKGAAINNRGLHAHYIQSPAQFRANPAKGRPAPDRPAPDRPAPDRDCLIKGNISSKGARIYHVPGQRDYQRTVISENKGERWFCTAENALDAGWRKAKR